MKFYAAQGFDDFILCLGFKGNKIRDYFQQCPEPGWSIKFLNTGVHSSKSERLMKAKPFLKGDFFLAYADDLSDIDLKALLKFHKKKGKVLTTTGLQEVSPFGIIDVNRKGEVIRFREKPILEHLVNIGFMAVSEKIFDYLSFGDLEHEVFQELVKRRQLAVFNHSGSWINMNTLRQNMELNELWDEGKAFWKVWK